MPTVRPKPGEYNAYYDRYISLIPGSDILATLVNELPKTVALLSAHGEEDGEFRYAPDKWSVKEVVGHMNDTERIMTYRALRIARNDRTPIEGFEQDDYIRGGGWQIWWRNFRKFVPRRSLFSATCALRTGPDAASPTITKSACAPSRT